MTVASMVASLLRDGLDDWVGIWEMAGIVRASDRAMTPPEVQQESMSLLKIVVGGGLAEVGDVRDSGFQRWEGNRESWLTRVDAEWSALRGHPSLGEIGWLNLTEEGENQARLLTTERGDDSE